MNIILLKFIELLGGLLSGLYIILLRGIKAYKVISLLVYCIEVY